MTSLQEKYKKQLPPDIPIEGFDKSGEPSIRVYESGALEIIFEFMPPLNGEDDQSDLEIFENFDDELSKVTGCEVIWQDREVFLIPSPRKNTTDLIRNYLSNFWEPGFEPVYKTNKPVAHKKGLKSRISFYFKKLINKMDSFTDY